MGPKSHFSLRKQRDQAQEEDNEPIEDEYARRHIEILTDKLQEMKEKFVELIEKVMGDENNPTAKRQAAEDETTDESDESDEEEEEEEDDSSSVESEEEADKENVSVSNQQSTTLKSVIQRQSRQIPYLKYIENYPKIMNYLSNDDPNCEDISRNDLEPFVKEHITDKPTESIYKQLTDELRQIHRSSLKNLQ